MSDRRDARRFGGPPAADGPPAACPPGTGRSTPWCVHHGAAGCEGQVFSLPGTRLLLWMTRPARATRGWSSRARTASSSSPSRPRPPSRPGPARGRRTRRVRRSGRSARSGRRSGPCPPRRAGGTPTSANPAEPQTKAVAPCGAGRRRSGRACRRRAGRPGAATTGRRRPGVDDRVTRGRTRPGRRGPRGCAPRPPGRAAPARRGGASTASIAISGTTPEPPPDQDSRACRRAR